MPLNKLANIGKVTASALTQAGIDTSDKLRACGAKQAFLAIRRHSDPEACLRVLYGLEGALRGIKDTALDAATKEDLISFFRDVQRGQPENE